MVENRPDKTLKNLQENKLDNSADNGPTRIKNIFQVVKNQKEYIRHGWAKGMFWVKKLAGYT